MLWGALGARRAAFKISGAEAQDVAAFCSRPVRHRTLEPSHWSHTELCRTVDVNAAMSTEFLKYLQIGLKNVLNTASPNMSKSESKCSLLWHETRVMRCFTATNFSWGQPNSVSIVSYLLFVEADARTFQDQVIVIRVHHAGKNDLGINWSTGAMPEMARTSAVSAHWLSLDSSFNTFQYSGLTQVH